MSRPLRIEYPGAIYHVINRGLERRAIFPSGEAHRALFKDLLADTVQKWKIVIHAYSLMPNHYHMLIETPLGNISRAMRHIDGLYTQRLNRSVSRDGPLFRGRFKSLLVQADLYFLELVRYIHLNGVKANLYPDAGVDRTASHWDYLHPKQAPPWLERNRALSYFQAQPDPLKAFDAFVHQGVPKHVENALSQKKWPAIWGVKSFVDNIKERYLPKKNQPHPEIPQKRPIALSTLLSPTEVEGIVRESLNGGEKAGAAGVEARWLMMWALREFSQLSFRDIGERVGGKSSRAIQKYLARYDFREGPNAQHIRQGVQCHM